MDLGIAGKVAVVAGGSKGIGRAAALELARNGCKLVIAARTQKNIDEVVDVIRAEGGQAVGVATDLLQLDNYAKVLRAAEQAFGAPDIAIQSIDGPKSGSFHDLTEVDFAEAFHLSVLTFSRFVRSVIPHMKQQRWGRIVLIGSGAVKQPVRSTLNFSYALTNTVRIAAVGLQKTLASELAPFGVTVNTVATGVIDTEQRAGFFKDRAADLGMSEEAWSQAFLSVIPMGRYGKPEEEASLAVYLCSQRAGYTTGETILCDGGFVQSMF
ncbi:MAG: family oxidoreductase [Hydrocarboniphaga sp.]|uniref:SDR family oxidoreductase n=1 Tax=Hydrocarboniphaga sp. TaxID=2033016 RepID=UPI0026095A16|nr:SDR family oxidoreductase [Hydrocarboniphaga sp.]MDB5970638.1 family oxidoreductase [Hydrocarboniphaga sp.]